MSKTRKPRPTCPLPLGVPMEQTIGPIDYEGYDTPYRNMDEPRRWMRAWEWLIRPSPPRD